MRIAAPLVIARIEGGLGNQMFQYAMARRTALAIGGKLKLHLDWFKTQSKREYELPRFNIDADIASSEDVSAVLGSGLVSRFLSGVERFKPYNRRRLITERSFRFDKRFLQIPGPAYLQGYWQSPKYFDGIEGLLRQEFTPKNPISANAAKLHYEIGGAMSVAVHCRRGDYVKEEHIAKRHGVCSIAYYREAMQIVLRKFPAAHFFCFSDDPGWVKANIKAPGPITYVDFPRDCGSTDELYLMSRCTHHIISNSTYGWWGAWLADGDRLTIAPKRWFRDPTIETRDLFPPEWVLL
jgi:Glycosyl transferase family 11